MNTKLIIGSLLAVVILVLVSFTSVVGKVSLDNELIEFNDKSKEVSNSISNEEFGNRNCFVRCRVYEPTTNYGLGIRGLIGKLIQDLEEFFHENSIVGMMFGGLYNAWKFKYDKKTIHFNNRIRLGFWNRADIYTDGLDGEKFFHDAVEFSIWGFSGLKIYQPERRYPFLYIGYAKSVSLD